MIRMSDLRVSTTNIVFSSILAALVLASGCSPRERLQTETEAVIVKNSGSTPDKPSAAAQRCKSLLNLSASELAEPSARIHLSNFNLASEPGPQPPEPWLSPMPALAAHCEVQGVMRDRVGSDGQQYAVKFRLRLPENWNGRFLFEGGGGTNGIVGDTIGRFTGGLQVGLNRGFAVVSTDTGHDNEMNTIPQVNGTVAFGLDYEARLEYAEKALDSVATTAKRIVESFYGRAPEFSYFAGCSNGGREGMVFAQRFPHHFDGILATAPAFAVPKAAIAEAWDTQVFSKLAAELGHFKENGLPDMSQTYSAGDLRLVASAATAACDARDGIADGLINDVDYCNTERVLPKLAALTCQGEKTESCLLTAQVDALVSSFSGPKNSLGEALYSAWPWDSGVTDMGWRIWKIGIPGGMEAINTTLGAQAMAGLFVTPPDRIVATPDGGQAYQLNYNFDVDAKRIFNVTKEFPRSSWDLVGAKNTVLDDFRDRGGKMLIPHGAADPIFSIYDTLSWWRAVDQQENGTAADFVRVFNVPGMVHCAHGPATNEFDAIGALVKWVEQDVQPQRVEAVAGEQTPWPGRQRPLCSYPNMAIYREGDPELSESFACATRPY